MNNGPEGRQIAVVTGAAGGLGAAIVASLLERGDKVVATDVNDDALQELREKFPQSVDALETTVADVASEESWNAIREAASSQFGAPTILVNNAGISPKHNGKKLEGIDIPKTEWDAVLGVNLTGPFLGIKTLAPGMIEQGYGRIINIASVAARYGGRLGGLHYASTKTGLLGVTRAFAQELAEFGITVNAVAPGRIASGMASMVGDNVNTDYATTIPVGRLGTAEDVAHTVRFLSEPDSSFITGATVDVNGGSHMQ
ncbi:SDR family oxidoreductase [Gulosibacter molinativorax]|uniref:SDR family oxidoreductase n=1 Tax=Gulosibacter molinativorax TaxID=256821 RepID=A0ABT7C872_9MICO|nr:SDR family NAD(P)-dependent oxidoreductase [Gulosibacter molinativorax]MDJ1371393.1 SDR family oxidoreductase [Gulosibacter molinativorax]QUY62891.1 3-oxoacyl-[acyl-carrier protein] reductase [Gulosibacter molinativorax]